MQVILLHPRFSRAKSITLGGRHIAMLIVLFLIAVLLTTVLLYFLTFRYAGSVSIPFMKTPVSFSNTGSVPDNDKFLKENLAAMAIKLGQMQAQLLRLDALGERVQGLAGVKPEEFNFKGTPGTGGAEPSSMNERKSRAFGITEFQLALDSMARDIGHRADYMDVLESTLMSDKIKAKLLPTNQPVAVNYNSSSFGWRVDPFTGRSAFHEGLDFPAMTGTPIVAAAAGVVIAAEYHPAYGNMLEIDHGNDIVTRYAHASKLLGKVGDIVQRGQHVADIGSTGRSTGPHLHFEVRIKGGAQDPRKFLAAGTDQAKMAVLIGR
ncbi:M23 family metallopeptidase [Glaciimonas sp. Gout2]|uniref:M23 family metallopeptidase n=1 Tax=unclassified Glaciimonas TaxID=2644401 RepID=UPI002B22D0C6|nr:MULTISPECIES: M23 family metallopeptidase [unclassified Glaciimonas]MEB0012895.1 M23 family metallopeptidase [Glaciimonas sp. Cout2]MEB0080814.1 M23 family metallopeptidase [Glaciimonas sp. Gout2]